VKIKWLGHSTFLITSLAGTRIITDPYKVIDELKYAPIRETADIVTVSHNHRDHNNANEIPGHPQIVTQIKPITIKDVGTRDVPAFHDTDGGAVRGKNIIFCLTVDNIRICHMGDIGHIPDEMMLQSIGQTDVLMIPTGGFYTLDMDAVNVTVETIAPRIVLPMHYKNDKCGFPIAPIDDFLQGKTDIQRENSSQFELIAGQLPSSTRIIILKPAQ